MVKVIPNKENIRKCFYLEEPIEIEQLNIMWYSEWDSGTEKGTSRMSLVKTKGIQIKYRF
jgi:hypothetical protein